MKKLFVFLWFTFGPFWVYLYCKYDTVDFRHDHPVLMMFLVEGITAYLFIYLPIKKRFRVTGR